MEEYLHDSFEDMLDALSTVDEKEAFTAVTSDGSMYWNNRWSQRTGDIYELINHDAKVVATLEMADGILSIHDFPALGLPA